MVKYATALRMGTAEAEQVLRRFTRGGPKHPIRCPGRARQRGADDLRVRLPRRLGAAPGLCIFSNPAWCTSTRTGLSAWRRTAGSTCPASPEPGPCRGSVVWRTARPARCCDGG
ncbi:hypothetical protein ACQUSR_33600 [Streptomyces sp. P1-3]|uniref:hypothetical protein n=1 Tax=Streptomyces sp. P1-3 TaxID=3421658 RepID=UPI003D36EF2F